MTFLWGTATSAFQIEGSLDADGRGESIWDRFPGAEQAARACDHYVRWQEDLDLLAGLGVNAYRFSIAWPRVVPDGIGAVNSRGFEFYRRLCEGCLERRIRPLPTLYHWDLPASLDWASPATAGAFADYAAVCAERLGDVVEDWVTVNEPWVVAVEGYALGRKAPGRSDPAGSELVREHLFEAHRLGTQAIRAARPSARVGIALNLSPVHPASDDPDDVEAARRLDEALNGVYLDAALEGDEPVDFLGVNYYTRVLAGADARPRLPVTDFGWEVYPDGLRELLDRIHDEYEGTPVLITENGAAYGGLDDEARIDYLRAHVEAFRASRADVRGYFVWSLLDNVEWEHGTRLRFGLVHVDFETQRRTPKRSFHWYRDRIAAAEPG